MLTEEHINYIIKDITYRGIVDEELGDELVDHISVLVEEKMKTGLRFIEAYDKTIGAFGRDDKMLELQNELTNQPNNTYVMIGNYFKVAFRNLTKHKFYSAINIAGLAIGVACTLLIYLYVSNEMNYDRFHKDGDRIFRIVRHGSLNGLEFDHAVSPATMAFSMVAELPEVEQAVRFRRNGSYLVKNPDSDESTKENGVVFTDSTFFEIFSFEVIDGSADASLTRPKTLAISQSAAKKYFKSVSPIGKTLIMDGKDEYEVTAVFEDMPANSHLQFDFLLSMSSYEGANNQVWLSNNFYTYFKLREDVNPKEFTAKLNDFYYGKIEPELQRFAGVGLEEFRAVGNHIELEAQLLADVYLTSNFTFDIGKTGNEQTVYLFIAIALFILGLACINFMNLSTARSATRAKEVGVRKALGSYRSHLVRQFLTESIIISLAAFILGFVLVVMVLPGFNLLAERTLAIPVSDISFAAILLMSAIIIGVIAGFYPAFFLSSFKPVNTLKGKLGMKGNNSFLRSSLVVFQFFVSIVLIIGTIAIQKQLDFIQNKKLGFNKEQVLLIHDAYMLTDSREAFKEELSGLNQVISASYSGFIPVNGYNRSDNMYWKKGVSPGETNSASTQTWAVDDEYIETMGMELVEGRNFDKNLASDSMAVIINEEALRKFEFENKDEWYIQTFAYDQKTGTVLSDVYETYHVIGVVKDFHFESLKQNISPLMLKQGNSTSVLSVRLSTDDYKNTIEQVEETWKKFGPGLPFNYNFMDDQFNKMYRSEVRLGTVFGVFAALAIIIGCLGLFALATFMAEQRIKEIGIRKVLGANVKGLVLMLTKDFSKLIILAFVLAAPLSFWLLSIWLNDYTYRIDLSWDLFAIAGLVAFIIAWATVSYQSVRAALSNPVESLKSE